MYFQYASPLMMLLLAGVDCSVNKEKFKLEPSLANKVCPVDRKAFEQQAISLISCVHVAFRTTDSVGVSYNEEQQMCYGCDTSCELGEFQPLSGTVLYGRPKACPDCFEDTAGYMLMVVNDQNLTYDQANCVCAEHSASLVRIDSSEKQAAIMAHLNGLSTGGTRYWIQCRKDLSGGLWKCDDGQKTNQKLAWGYPKTGVGRNCGYVRKDARYWMNAICEKPRSYICEI